MTDTITTTNTSDPVYWLNRDDAEARRLILQGRLYYPPRAGSCSAVVSGPA